MMRPFRVFQLVVIFGFAGVMLILLGFALLFFVLPNVLPWPNPSFRASSPSN